LNHQEGKIVRPEALPSRDAIGSEAPVLREYQHGANNQQEKNEAYVYTDRHKGSGISGWKG